MPSKYREIDHLNVATQNNIRLLEAAIPAFDFELPYLSSMNKIKLSDFKNRIILLCFWSSQSLVSKSALVIIEQWYLDNKLGEVTIIAINSDSSKPRLEDDIVDLNGITMLWDKTGEITKRYEIKQFPSTILIDKEGMIRDEKAGGPIEDWDRLVNRIDILNNEKSDLSSIYRLI